MPGRGNHASSRESHLAANVISPQTSSRRECHLAANVMDIRSFAAVKKSSGAFAPQQSDRSAAARSRWHSHSWLCTLPSPIVGFAVGTDKQNPPPIAASLTACRHASPVRLHSSVVIPSPLAFATKSQVRGAWCLTKSRGLRPSFLRRARNPSCVLHLARFVAQGAPQSPGSPTRVGFARVGGSQRWEQERTRRAQFLPCCRRPFRRRRCPKPDCTNLTRWPRLVSSSIAR